MIFFAPDINEPTRVYGETINVYPTSYSYRSLIKQFHKYKLWTKYDAFSGTTEDPMSMVGLLSSIYRKPSFTLADEIKSGSFAGNRSGRWKAFCRWAMRKSKFQIVNDDSRKSLLQDYVGLTNQSSIIKYPGSYHILPDPVDQDEQRNKWNLPKDNIYMGFSGTFYSHNGIEWAIDSFYQRSNINLVIQPVNLDSTSKYLLSKLEDRNRIFVEPHRLTFLDAWSQASAMDIGVSVYLHDGPQFRNMGISSNRLCMFLAMGIPVITSKQQSFEFIEKYDCGVMVSNADEFVQAFDYISLRLAEMKKNARYCAEEYINAGSAFETLKVNISDLFK